jgi:hypothetical protein
LKTDKGKEGNGMIMLSSVKAHKRAASHLSTMILIALLMLPLACASVGQKRNLKKVKPEVEGTWILEEWHMKGEAVSPPKVDGRFIIHDNAIVLILINRAGEGVWSYYGYGKYTLDASTFSMGFDEVAMFTESTSGTTVSRKLTWDGQIKSFEINMENNQLHLRCADIGYHLIVEGDTLIFKRKGEIARIYRRAGAK